MHANFNFIVMVFIILIACMRSVPVTGRSSWYLSSVLTQQSMSRRITRSNVYFTQLD